MKISFIQPSRNNLKYLKWSYESIRKNQGNHEVEICVADDASTDGTWDWCQERMAEDEHFKAIRNETDKRLGHTILYDRLANEVASHDMCMIYHADMYLCPGALDAIENEMYMTIDNGDNGVRVKREKTITSLTRIEPPLHPDGPEKILKDFGVEPEEFNEQGLLDFINSRVPTNDTTEGIFAPWAFWKSDFQEIGGHDPLYAPQSKEDSDIFNRFQLNGVKFIQTWHGCVYHMTCRGSRRNTVDGAPNIQTNNPEWEAQNIRSSRNFIRKWGHFVKHDRFMKPIIPPKYNIEFRIFNCTLQALAQLEPWCSTVFCDLPADVRRQYIEQEQPNTKMNLSRRVYSLMGEIASDSNILVRIDCNKFDWKQDFYYIQNMSEIINNSGELGTFDLGNLRITIEDMSTYESDLIVCESNIYSK
jgi:glycosyltransferase involved in cell wall biosynthesis